MRRALRRYGLRPYAPLRPPIAFAIRRPRPIIRVDVPDCQHNFEQGGSME